MFKIAAVLWIIIGTVFAGIAVMTVLSVPALAAHAGTYIPYGAIAGFVIAVPVAFVVAGRMSKAFAGQRGA